MSWLYRRWVSNSPCHVCCCVCRDKFGESGARVFKLLAGAGQQLEQRAVSERAMLPIKTARELLYRMLKARYVSMQVLRAPASPPRHLSASCSI